MSTLKINEALGDVLRPLKVGDTVVTADGETMWFNGYWTTGPFEVTEVGIDPMDKTPSHRLKGDEFDKGDPAWDAACFRRVDPPSSKVDEVAELRRQLAEAQDQLATVTRERDEWKAKHNNQVISDQAEAFSAAARFRQERDNAIAEANDLRTKLATAEADAAAMRPFFDKALQYGEGWKDCGNGMVARTGNLPPDDVRISITASLGEIRKIINGTAGRELLDRHKAEIAKIKSDYECEVRNLLRTIEMYRGKDQSSEATSHELKVQGIRRQEEIAAKNAAIAELRAWIETPAVEPIYWIKDTGTMWRLINGQLQYKHRDLDGPWCDSNARQDVLDSSDDITGCNADGTPLANSDDDLLRKLRELLRGTSSISIYGGNRVVIYYGIKDGVAIHKALIAIRDGGAK